MKPVFGRQDAYDPGLTGGRTWPIITGDKNYHGKDFEATLADGSVCLLRPARKG